MISLTQLWLPILLSAVFVFIASSILHMVLPIHKNDFKPLPNEEEALKAMRSNPIPTGLYFFPFSPRPQDMNSPEMKAKLDKGPVGFMTVLPNGPLGMGKNLLMWFIYCLVIGVFVAYLAGRTLSPDTNYLAVFRMCGTVSFLGYAGSYASNSIWMGQPWSVTVKHILDGLIFALVTGGTFGWLWP